MYCLFYKKNRILLCLFFLSLLIISVPAEVIKGVILDSELDIPVKNVSVVLENIEVFSDVSGEFLINTDFVQTIDQNNGISEDLSIKVLGLSKQIQIKFAQKNILNSIEIRNVKGVSLYSYKENRASVITIPINDFAQGMFVLTIKNRKEVKHYWICKLDNSNLVIRNRTESKNSNVVASRVAYQGNNKKYTLNFTKAGYDSLIQGFDDVSTNLEIKMNRFDFCGNDVKEGNEVCDGETFPCNILNPLDYALGEASCNDQCGGYESSDCVPHPITDVSGNNNGDDHKMALDITSLAQYNILQQIQVGMIEGNFHDIIDSVYNEHGANGVAFNHITGSGPNSIILHYEGKNRTLVDGDVLLVDIGATYNDYCGDVTRTYPVNGKFSDRQREVYQLVLDAKNAAAKEMRPNVHSLSQMSSFVSNFFKNSSLRAKDSYGNDRTMDYFFKHGLSHYVGTDVHGSDLGFSNSEPVRPGRIFTIEPGLYIESEGFGIRLEDCYIMSNNGAENIMPNIAIEVDHIEAIMAARELNHSPDSYNKTYVENNNRSTHMEF